MSHDQIKTVRLSFGEEIIIRPAVSNDAAKIIAHVRRVLTECPDTVITRPSEFTVSEEEESEWIRDHSESEGKILLVAQHGDDLVGMVNFSNKSRELCTHSGTLGMSVNPYWHRRGVGSALLGALLDWAQSHPLIEKVSLAVFATNKPAVELYRKFGFQEEGRRPNEYRFPDGRYVDDILMYKMTTER